MVKKTSILDKFKSRFKASPVSVEAGRTAGVDANNRVSTDALATPLAERVPGRKLSAKEDAVVTMGEGFRELNNLVRGVQTRMESQTESARSVADDVKALPALGQAQLELLRKMAGQMDKQNEVSHRLLASLDDLPETLSGVKSALDRAAATDERTANTLGEFRETMDRIQGAMHGMVESSAKQADAAERLVSDRRGERDGLVDAMREAHAAEAETLATTLNQARAADAAAMRDAQAEQTKRLDRMAKDGSRWGHVVVILLAMTFLAMAGVLAVTILR